LVLDETLEAPEATLDEEEDEILVTLEVLEDTTALEDMALPDNGYHTHFV